MKHISLTAMWLATGGCIAYAMYLGATPMAMLAFIIPAITHEGAVKRN